LALNFYINKLSLHQTSAHHRFSTHTHIDTQFIQFLAVATRK
jgi:hypothetical protein